MSLQIRSLESLNSHVADGTQTVWNFSFAGGYLNDADVRAVSVAPDGTATTRALTLNSTSQLTISPAVPNGHELTIYRKTQTSAPLVDFTTGASVSEASLDLMAKQAVFAAAEAKDWAQLQSAWSNGQFAQSQAQAAAASAAQAAGTAASFNDASLVHKATAETITGVKTFAAAPIFQTSLTIAAGVAFTTVAPTFGIAPAFTAGATFSAGTVNFAGSTVNGLTKSTVGLANVDNTADTAKPVSTAQQTALNAKLDIASFFGFRNKIRNPRMDLVQRGTSFAALSNGSSYSLDGWQFGSVGFGGTLTVSQQADAPADNEFQSSLRVAVTAADATVAAGDYTYIRQPIEGYLVRDLIGKPIAIQFRVRSAKVGTHCVAVQNVGTSGTPDRSYVLTYTVNVANTWETKTLTLPEGLLTVGTWNWINGVGCYLTFVLACGTTFQTATPFAWLTGNLLATSAQVNVLDTVGNIFAITGVQLEKGSGTPFEHRDIAAETALNWRYYQQAYAGSFRMYVNNVMRLPLPFAVPMRAIPTLTRATTGNTGLQSEQSSAVSPSAWQIDVAFTAGGTGVIDLVSFTVWASAEL